MKIKLLKLKNWLLVTVMGALGLSGCQCHKKSAQTEIETDTIEVRDRGEVRLMYGVPTMNYMIRGQVRGADDKPLRDIRVNMLECGMEVTDGELQGDPDRVKQWLEGTSVATDNHGHFVIQTSGIPQEQVRLLVRDADGRLNGEYRNQVVEIDVNGDNIDRTEAAGWHQGTFHKEVGIRLENK